MTWFISRKIKLRRVSPLYPFSYCYLVFFILRGQVLMYIDLNDQDDADNQGTKDGQVGAFEVPFNMYIQGSYFGDSDFYDKKTDKFLDNSTRCNSTEASKECHLMQVKVKELKQLFVRFKDISK
jgi:hypothetical protein